MVPPEHVPPIHVTLGALISSVIDAYQFDQSDCLRAKLLAPVGNPFLQDIGNGKR